MHHMKKVYAISVLKYSVVWSVFKFEPCNLKKKRKKDVKL